MTQLTHRRATTYAPTPYPGEIPDAPFCLDDGTVVPLQFNGRSYLLPDGDDFTNWMAGRDHHYVPLAVYGSNACPGRLAEKFGPAVDGIVVLPATLTGAVRVWARAVSSRGSVPMTLAAAPNETETAHLLLLPEHYAERMDATEGRHGSYYSLGRLTDCTLRVPGAPPWHQPITYVGHSQRGPLIVDGTPLTYATTEQTTAFTVITTGPEPVPGDHVLPRTDVIDRSVHLRDAVSTTLDAALGPWLRPT